MASPIEWHYILYSYMDHTHGWSLHPISRTLGLCASGWDRNSHFLGFYLIFISALEDIRYLMTYSPDARKVSNTISSFGDIVDNCCV